MSAELTDDLEIIKNVRNWPMHPFLPVKKAGMTSLLDENFGVVGANNNGPIPVVFLVNLYSINAETDFNKLKKFEYSSIEELLMEWTID